MIRQSGMSSLQRYRKPGGFLQLLSLLETFGPAKRAKFLEMIEGESRPWAEALSGKMLTMDRVGEWPTEALTQILKTLPVKSQAYALAGFPKDVKDRVWRALPVPEQRRLTEVYGENNPRAEEITSIVSKFVESARRLLIDRELNAEIIDPTLIIVADIEFRLDAGISVVADVGATEAALEVDARAALKDARRENQNLRDEVAKLREKLDQIKRFAA